jgi:hypothetical protein
MKILISANARFQVAMLSIESSEHKSFRVELSDDSTLVVDALGGAGVTVTGEMEVQTRTKLTTTVRPNLPGARGHVTVETPDGGKVELDVEFGRNGNVIVHTGFCREE